jgi:hypothetical protein
LSFLCDSNSTQYPHDQRSRTATPDVEDLGGLPENAQILKYQYGDAVMRGERLVMLSKQQAETTSEILEILSIRD